MKRRLLIAVFTILLILLALVCLSRLGFGKITSEALALRPYPDVVEQMWQAQSFADGRSALMPIGLEMHPPRYAPIHPLFLAGWIKLCGTRQSVHWWAPFALMAGFVLLFFALPMMNIDRVTGFLSLAVIATSVLVIRISQSLLQESTVFLLFSADIWLNCRRGRREKERLVFSGVLAGALLCIRPTYALWPVCVIAFNLWKLGGVSIHARLRYLVLSQWPYAFGMLLIVSVETLYIYSLSGRLHTHLYSHWQNTDRLFSLKNFTMRNSWSHYPMKTTWEQVGLSLLGIHTDVSALGWRFNSIILLGSAFGLKYLIQKKSFVVVLLTFAILQVVAHTFYRVYAPRFMIAVCPWLIISGVAGWKLLAGKVLENKSVRVRVIVLLLISAALLALLIEPRAQQRISRVYNRLSTDKKIDAVRSDLHSYSLCREVVRVHRGALYVDSIDTVAARLLLGIVAWRYPIYQFSGLDNWWEAVWMDGHYCELPYAKPIKRADFNQGERGRPYEVFLVKNAVINTAQLNADLQHGGVMIMFPSWRHQEFSQAVDELNAKYNCTDRTPKGSNWKLYQLTKNTL